ncbi:MAG: rhodanese-related sulfurtransferase [Saprospiraceae bacterium]|nr:rhodanese-related sulfurtransferase [Saprospiraceae bacterium]MBP7699120.1 rhodanese-related sulfurtransferase [Saprospiraceae bacterium]
MKLHNRINRNELKMKMLHSSEQRTTISFYRYMHLLNPQFFRDFLYLTWQPLGVLGRVYVAKEGINAQISVPTININSFIEKLNEVDYFVNMRLNYAIEDDGKSFFALTIKVRNKIVADGIEDPNFDPTNIGIHLKADEFNRLTADTSTVLIDMRNHYESEVGHFKNAVCPDIDTFRESLPIIAEMFEDAKDKNVVMYCTGGIRCEKASAYMKYRGFKNVYQLEGGIIEYARQVKNQGLENRFVGKNFVFDERLGERINEEIIAHCHQCGEPSDMHHNCANDACHILFIQCPTCAEKYNACCSEECSDFMQLSGEEQRALRKDTIFNGTKFGKHRYRPTA